MRIALGCVCYISTEGECVRYGLGGITDWSQHRGSFDRAGLCETCLDKWRLIVSYAGDQQNRIEELRTVSTLTLAVAFAKLLANPLSIWHEKDLYATSQDLLERSPAIAD